MGPSVFQDLVIAGQDWSTGLERCGILFGTKDEAGEAYVAGCAELENVAADPAHNYEFEASAQAKAWSRVERWGYEVLGIWHTHPSGPQGPSQTDLAYAQPWFVYPVLWPRPEGYALQVYVLDPEEEMGYAQIPYTVMQEAASMAQNLVAAKAMDKAKQDASGYTTGA